MRAVRDAQSFPRAISTAPSGIAERSSPATSRLVCVSVDPGVMRRLALIRLLLGRAEDAAKQPAPYSTDAINRAHDVAEMWLALAVEATGLSIPKEFMAYWPELEKGLGRPLAYKVQMTRLNKTRINLKHYGIEPAPEEVKAATATVRSLLTDETPEVFGVELSAASLAVFVTSEAASKSLTQAEDEWGRDESDRAMADLSEAFDHVIRDYVASKRRGTASSVFTSVGPLENPFNTWHRTRPNRGSGVQPNRDMERWQQAVEESVIALDETVTLVGLGVDIRRYGMFRSLVPRVTRMVSGKRTIVAAGPKPSSEQFEFCRDFVVQTALYLAEFDYQLDGPTPRDTAVVYVDDPSEPG